LNATRSPGCNASNVDRESGKGGATRVFKRIGSASPIDSIHRITTGVQLLWIVAGSRFKNLPVIGFIKHAHW
jgi:hypothetical protein